MRLDQFQKILKKSLAFIISLILILQLLPWQVMKVYAFDRDRYKVDSVTVFKVYDVNKNLAQRRILILGSYLQNATVGIITSSGYQELSNRTVNSDGLLQFDLSNDQLGNSILIEGFPIPINEGQMPTLTGVNRKIKVGVDSLVIQGTNLMKIKDEASITAGYEHEGAYTEINEAAAVFDGDTSLTVNNPSGALGYQNIIFQKTEVIEDQDFNDANQNIDVAVTVKYTYQEQFRFVRDITVSGLTMRPNRGEKGETIFIESPANTLDNYDVFFLKKIDGTEAYTNANKGKNKTFQQNVSGRDILTVQVPDLAVGEYYVILTNPVSASNDPMKEVVMEKVLTDALNNYERFTVIDASVKSRIISVQPDKGPDTGSKVTVSGQFFISMNIPEYIPANSSVRVENPVGDANPKELVVDYSTGGASAGSYNGIPVSSVQRRISVIIGGATTFLTKASEDEYDVVYNPDLDRLVVQTPQVTDADEDPLKDVVIETETVFIRQADGGTIIIKERAELKDSYNYISSKIEPRVTSVTPGKIQVIDNPLPDSGNYVIPGDVTVAIHGSNFMIHKFTKTVNGQDVEVVRYPIIEFGPDIRLNKNVTVNPGDPASDTSLNIRVFNSAGDELDGSQGSEIGTKILVTIPKDKTVSILGKTYIKVSNPVRNSENTGLSALNLDAVEFVNPDASRNPIITNVTPSVVTVDGGELITVEGSNFVSGVKVFMDGTEITPVTRQGDGKKITFTCPKGREGETQLQVMNPDGGIAIWPVTFVRTYTNPRITDFSPKTGNTGTLVIVNGDNFLKPEPAASATNPYMLIGSRILLEGKDVNEYYMNPITRKIELQGFVSPDDVLLDIGTDSITGQKYIKVADYFNSILLRDTATQRYYTLDVDARGRVILSDGAGNSYVMDLGLEDGTVVIHAKKEGGNTYVLTSTQGTVTLDDRSGAGEDITFDMLTLYRKDENGRITGNRVRVVDRNHIYFKVPILEADGFYDVTVINPDTKKDSKVDQQGFYYYSQPQTKPTITDIEPDEGSVSGGYTIRIFGSEFEDNGTTKTKVFINGMEVAPANVSISTDGTSITVIVPAYPGDLVEDHGTSRYTVPVVVVNPDGGSFSKEDGFTYTVPGSHPQITRIVPATGGATGGDVVEITGTDFRYFEPFDDLNRNQVCDESETFNDINHNGLWDSDADFFYDHDGDPDTPEVDWRQPTAFSHRLYTDYYASPILPRVYFGSETAQIVEFSRGYIKVIVPPGTAGKVDVSVVNNDSGVSNKVAFTYLASQPTISTIVPAEGKKQGGDRIEILGSDFQPSSLLQYQLNGAGNVVSVTKTMPLVRFGNITNRSLPREHENSGRIDNGRATVRLTGGLTIEYNSVTGEIKLIVEDRGIFQRTIAGYEGSTAFIPVSLLRDSQGTAYAGLELIRVQVLDRRLIVERGYAPLVEYINAEQLVVHTPSYYTVGEVPVTVINPDGGTAVGEFEYKNPASRPRITNITKEYQSPERETIDGRTVRVLRMSYKGGSIVSVIGEDFRENARIQIGDLVTIAPSEINYQLPNRLTFEMPAVDESAVGKLQRVIVQNEDGAFQASDELSPPIYIIFTKGDTSPVIETITPDKGPASGGIRVKIEGNDFRERMDGYDGRIAVYFGEIKVPDSDVTYTDYKTLYVIVPANAPGKVKVRVENPDGELSNSDKTFTYLSTPKIVAVVDPTDLSENARITSISVEGGQEIKVKGSGFMDGARVVFVPVIRKAAEEELDNGELIYIGDEQYVLESGKDGSSVTVIDSETLLVETPQGRVDTFGIMVINPDGGATAIYEGLKYDLPGLSAPTGVRAELLYDRYIKVSWSAVAGAKEYEIYVVIGDNITELAGSTSLSSFVYSDLEPNTSYRFIVKTIGDFGPSKPSEESNRVRTGKRVGPPDDDGKINEETRTEKVGDLANVSVGEKDYDEKELVIDLTRGSLAGSKEVTVSIPASVVISPTAKDITVIGKDFSVKFNPGAFNFTRVSDNRDKEDAGVRFRIYVYNGAADSQNARTEGTPLSTQYCIEVSVYIGKDITKAEYLNKSAELTLDYDSQKAQMRRLDTITLNRYGSYNEGWTPVSTGSVQSASVTAAVTRPGIYMVFGKKQ